MLELEAGVDDGLVVQGLDEVVRVSDTDLVDESAGIGTAQDQAQLTDDAVEDLLGLLLQPVRVDRERDDVSVLDQRLGVLGLGGVVEVGVCVHTVLTLLENRMTQNVLGVVVGVLPDEGDRCLVLVRERTPHDRSTVGALESHLGCVPAEVSVLSSHFEGLLPD